MNSRTLNFALVFVLLGLGYAVFTRARRAAPPTTGAEVRPAARPRSPRSAKSDPAPRVAVASVASAPSPAPESGAAKPVDPRPSLRYHVDDGIAVVQGDVAVGQLSDPTASPVGTVQLAPLKLWGDGAIAYWIQPGVDNPERVRQALRLFARTHVRFVEWTDQADALVFEPTTGICKSYLGKIGGHQPIWVAPNCGPAEIAHEILHALGFAHEQNRADRDDFITVNADGIEDEFRYNFDKLPPAFTKVNQAAPFDFTSLMMYPPWMFAKGGQTTMFPKNPDQRIAPGTGLSAGDERRVNLITGGP